MATRLARAITRASTWLLWLGLALGAALIIDASLVYVGEDLAPFFMERLPLPHEELWMTAVQVHVAAACFSLPACLILVVPWTMRRVPRLHRWLGRLTGVVLLLGVVPAGFYLSLFARGGILSTIGFMLTGAITAVAMVRAITSARSRDLRTHRKMTMHVLAQLSVAVTSRTILYGFAAHDYDSDALYIAALWGPVLLSALAVEWALARHRPTPTAPRAIRLVAVKEPV